MALPLIGAVEELVDQFEIDLIKVIFIVFIATIVVFGSLMTLVEAHLPNSIRQSFRYGKHSHKGPTDAIVSYLEVPKSWFKHFYMFSLVWSLLALYLIASVIAGQIEAPEYVLRFLDFISGGRSHREVLVDSNTALIGTVLLTLQCLRRFYETNFVQIFSKQSKMNLSHYFVGYIHYFGAIIALLSNTAGFVRGSKPNEFSLENITVLQSIYIVFFLFSWHQQFASNLLLVNLRKDAKTGAVKTEKHLMPTGGWFNLISSPHMFFEVVMYYCLADLFAPMRTWKLIFIWVASNQTVNALLTHQWYKAQFKDYPKRRHAIIPFML
ncbi:polyprenol reductase [Scaptodrosophila lebanonensis]|uniref:Polyprenal reductase n=1 Tax=Drosophila lebanonensis TaxID=7225 RepID=A0A6J2U8U0_DROLE|nr:polyprenol reductase [Scaptodrosophila lebanonensis]